MRFSKEKMIQDLVDDMENWDLDTLLGWAQAVRSKMLFSEDVKEIRDEWNFMFNSEWD
jgi:hypothetical protein